MEAPNRHFVSHTALQDALFIFYSLWNYKQGT